MSDITREGLKKISYILGEAQNSVLSLLGDLNKDPKSLLSLEALLCKMRGSTFFYNEDYSAFRYPADADPSVIETYDLVKFASSDNINFGIQGAFLTKNYDAMHLVLQQDQIGIPHCLAHLALKALELGIIMPGKAM